MYFLRALGGLDLRDADDRKVSAVLVHPKRSALLVYVMLAAQGRPIRRDSLLAVFWPESSQDLARASLRKALHNLRRVLGEDLFVANGDDEVSVADGQVTCDAIELAGADAARVAELYKGPFLDGVFLPDAPDFERWVERERVRLRDRAFESMWRRAEQEGASGTAYDAAFWARKALALVPNDEAALRRLLVLLDRVGDRAGALSAYDEFARRLSQDLDVETSAETQALVARIRVARTPEHAGAPADEQAGGRAERRTGAVADRRRDSHSHGPGSAASRAEVEHHSNALVALVRPFWKSRGIRVAAVVALAVAATWKGLRFYEAKASPPTPIATAVLPFTFRGAEEFSYLADGMPTLLGTSLDGVGMQTADSASARYYVAGDIFEAAGRLRISAELRDTRDRQTIAKAVAEDSASRIFALVEQLAAQLVASTPTARRERLTQLAAVTTSSLPALRAYLEGESKFRIGHYKEAVDAYQRAVRDDSTFALAYYRLAVAYGWSADTLARPTALRAVQLADRLSVTERMLLEAYVTYSRGNADEAERRYREIVRLRPFDGEAWYQLGEVLFHYNSVRGRPIQEARPIFQRALANGPKDATLTHLLEIEAIDGRYAVFDSLMGDIAPGAHFDLVGRTVSALSRNEAAERSRLIEENRHTTDPDLANYARHMLFLVADRERAASVVRLLLSPERPAEARALGHILLAHLEAAAGRLAATDAELRLAEALDRTRALEHRGLLESLPFLPVTQARRLATRKALAEWSGDAPASGVVFSDDRLIHDRSRQYLVGMLSAQLGDAEVARRAADEVARGAMSQRPFAIMLARGVRAQLLARDSRREEALAELSKPHTEPSVWELIGIVPFTGLGSERFLRAELLRELGRNEEALSWYGSFGQHSAFDRVFLAPAHRHMGQLLESARRSDEAIMHYEKFISLWKDSDPELRPLVSQARARVEGLRARR
ncbi:MAG: BTAD domain-containing putative transcriptional regulator [Gemmatimonadaceae bacterium]